MRQIAILLSFVVAFFLFFYSLLLRLFCSYCSSFYIGSCLVFFPCLVVVVYIVWLYNNVVIVAVVFLVVSCLCYVV